MLRIFQIAMIALSLAGCATADNHSNLDPQYLANVPTNHRQAIVDFVKTSLKDPYSIRSAGIAAPIVGFVGIANGGQAAVVCTRYNAKNSFGAYIGLQTVAYIFRNGRVAGVISESPIACASIGTAYMAFPELENIK